MKRSTSALNALVQVQASVSGTQPSSPKEDVRGHDGWHHWPERPCKSQRGPCTSSLCLQEWENCAWITHPWSSFSFFHSHSVSEPQRKLNGALWFFTVSTEMKVWITLIWKTSDWLLSSFDPDDACSKETNKNTENLHRFQLLCEL